MNLAVSPRRIALLARHDLVSERKSLITTAATLFGITVVFYLISGITEPSNDMTGLFMPFLYVGGYIAASVAFSDFQDAKTGMHYLMLPGSSVEKYIARLLLTSVGWTLGIIVVYTLGSVVGTLISLIYSSNPPTIFLPVGRAVWTGIGAYLLSQSVFVFGAIYFRKIAFLKVVLSSIVVVIAVAALSALTGWIAFGRELLEFMFGGNDVGSAVVTASGMTLEQLAETRWLPIMNTVSNVFTYGLVPVFFWVAGVVRLSETEV